MKKNCTEVVFVLDRSGSMCGLEKDTIGGFNSLINKDTFNKLGYKTKINTHTTSCINLFLDIYLYSEYRLIYC